MESEKKNVEGKATTTESTGPIKRDPNPKLPSLLAWGVGETAVAPLERLAILLQVQNSSNIINYMGTVQGLKYIWRTEGFRGLFKGNGIKCAHSFTYSAVKVFSDEQASRGILWLYRQQSGNEDAKITPLLRLGAGVCATIIAISATYPIDMVRGRITVQAEKSPYQYRGMFHALSTVLREEGARALYQGCFPFAFGLTVTPIIHLGLNVVVYEFLKESLGGALARRLLEVKEFELVEDTQLIAQQIALLKEGKLSAKQLEIVEDARLRFQQRIAQWDIFAAVIAHAVVYPFDGIHRRMQMAGWKNASSMVTGDGRGKTTLEYTGMVDAFRRTVRDEGFKGLYKGWVPNIVKVVPCAVVAFVTHKVLKDVLGVEVDIKTGAIGTP